MIGFLPVWMLIVFVIGSNGKNESISRQAPFNEEIAFCPSKLSQF